MAVDPDYLYSALLGHNYLPMVKEHRDETPSLFSTESLRPQIANLLVDRHAGFGRNHLRVKGGFDQIEYRTTRFNNVVRLMHVPHPMAYALLCRELRDAWGNVELNRICENPSSRIKPEQHEDGRVLIADDYDSLRSGRVVVMGGDERIADLLATLNDCTGMHYFVEADISSCFPSVYTHAIPWALVGIDEAKRRRNGTEWFNKIDKRQRDLKRGETQGVPVGPATSNIACEIVLYPVDEALRAKGYKFTRCIDDYRCYCATREKADEFLRDLERELGRYLLTINAKKVRIEPLPRPTTAPWVLELRARLPKGRRPSAQAVVDYLETAVSRTLEEPDGSVVKYAVRAISGKLTPDNRGVFCRYVTHLAVHIPVVLPILCTSGPGDGAAFPVEQLDAVLRRHIEYRRSDAVGWTLCLYGRSGLAVSEEAAKAIVASGDCMSMAALLAIGQHQPLVKAFVASLIGSQLYDLDKYWLLIHELLVRGDLPVDHALQAYAESTGLEDLADADVTFLRPPRSVEVEDPVEEDTEPDGLVDAEI